MEFCRVFQRPSIESDGLERKKQSAWACGQQLGLVGGGRREEGRPERTGTPEMFAAGGLRAPCVPLPNKAP